MDTSRRAALKVVGITVCGLAGCTSTEPDEATDETSASTADRTTTETPTATPTIDEQVQNLTFEAEMLAQQSAESPARFEARLTNVGSETITIGLGPTLMISDTPLEDPKWADELVIDPDSDIGPWSDPVQTDNNCWRFPEDPDRTVQSLLKYCKLEPSESTSEQYSVYTAATVPECLPAGRYTYQDAGSVYPDGPGGDPSSRVVVRTLHIDSTEAQQLSVSTESPVLRDP